jgi:hypothetical protein
MWISPIAIGTRTSFSRPASQIVPYVSGLPMYHEVDLDSISISGSARVAAWVEKFLGRWTKGVTKFRLEPIEKIACMLRNHPAESA